MLFYLQNEVDRVLIMARAESEGGDTVGDALWPVYPGEDFYGVDYNALRDIASKSGVLEIPDAAQ